MSTHRHASGPSIRADARLPGDVLEPHVSSVQVEAAGDHVAGEENVRQSVIVDVANGYSGAVVDIGDRSARSTSRWW